MKHHYLIDYENVHEEGLIGLNMIEDDAVIHIFYSDHARRLDLDSFREGQILQIEVLKVPVGKQSLDMQLVSYMGYLMGRERGEGNAFIIVSKDNGYLNSIPFWKQIMRDGTTVEVRPQIRAQDPEEVRTRTGSRRRNDSFQKSRGSRRAESDRRFDPAQEYQPEQKKAENPAAYTADSYQENQSDTAVQRNYTDDISFPASPDGVRNSKENRPVELRSQLPDPAVHVENQISDSPVYSENQLTDSIDEPENRISDSVLSEQDKPIAEPKDESSRRHERRSRSGRDRVRTRRERIPETDDQQKSEAVENGGRGERTPRNTRGRKSDRSRQRIREDENAQTAVNTETSASEQSFAPLRSAEQPYVRESAALPNQAAENEKPVIPNQIIEEERPVISIRIADEAKPAVPSRMTDEAKPAVPNQTAEESKSSADPDLTPADTKTAVPDQSADMKETSVLPQIQAEENVPVPSKSTEAFRNENAESVSAAKQPDEAAAAEKPQKKSRRTRQPRQKQEKTIDRAALNTAIMQTLSKADIDAATTGKVASTVLKNIDDAHSKAVTYREIIRNHGQKDGLKIYNMIKTLL